MERWERRARKVAKRRARMQVSGAGLKKIHLPLIVRKAEEAGQGVSPPSKRQNTKHLTP